mmetsp:Transcript_24848/g.78274  ORF Transcript_24848/g.78274 Transcript_24848/m.78274 type:complete len:114 (+) Transcript_24848:104-445(+)
MGLFCSQRASAEERLKSLEEPLQSKGASVLPGDHALEASACTGTPGTADPERIVRNLIQIRERMQAGRRQEVAGRPPQGRAGDDAVRRRVPRLSGMEDIVKQTAQISQRRASV